MLFFRCKLLWREVRRSPPAISLSIPQRNIFFPLGRPDFYWSWSARAITRFSSLCRSFLFLLHYGLWGRWAIKRWKRVVLALRKGIDFGGCGRKDCARRVRTNERTGAHLHFYWMFPNRERFFQKTKYWVHGWNNVVFCVLTMKLSITRSSSSFSS